MPERRARSSANRVHCVCAECQQSQALPPSIRAGPPWEHGILANPPGGDDENANKGSCEETLTPSVYILFRNTLAVPMRLSAAGPLIHCSV